jgi:hypothetical protein
MHMRTANFGSNLDACLLSHLRECHQFVWYIYISMHSRIFVNFLFDIELDFLVPCMLCSLPTKGEYYGGRIFELLVMMGKGK